MKGDFYACGECNLAYREQDTDEFWTTSYSRMGLSSPRACPIDSTRLTLINPDEIDPSIFDNMGERP